MGMCAEVKWSSPLGHSPRGVACFLGYPAELFANTQEGAVVTARVFDSASSQDWKRPLVKKRLIALRGFSGVGKSTSIHALYRLLISDPANKALSYQAHGRKLDFISIVEVGGYKVTEETCLLF